MDDLNLLEAGFDVREPVDGREALALILEEAIDLVLLDVRSSPSRGPRAQ